MTGAKKLAGFVTVNGTTYGPDDDLPADVAKQIDNPKAWGEQPDDEGKAPAKKAASSKSEK